MANSQVLEEITIGRGFLKLKFKFTVQVASLVKENFRIVEAEQDEDGNWVEPATPLEIALKDIIARDDFDSIRKELMIYFADLSEVEKGTYILTIDDLRTASGHDVPVEKFTFKYNFDNTAIEEAEEDEPVLIEDFSIKTVTIDQTPTQTSVNESFYVVETDPQNGQIFLETDYNDGGITIAFSDNIGQASITDTTLKVQRKQIGGSTFRWQAVGREFTVDGSFLEIDVASLDATPVFGEPGHEYFEDGYKYRIILSKNIENNDATPQSLGFNYEFSFLGALDPLLVDPEELNALYPEATLLEIAELVYRYSTEVVKVYGTAEELPLIAYEYIRAAVECALFRTHGAGLFGGGDDFTLGDLSFSTSAGSKKEVNRGNATTPCELAAALRQDMIRGAAGIKAVVTGTRYRKRIPHRHLKHAERGF